jgi:Secretion system C-terminal sorting domain
MRLNFYFFLALLSPLFCSAQNLMPSVTNLAGYEHTVAGLITTVSIGEPAILTLTSDNNSITQGFLQPENLPCENLSFNYYPNPTKGDLTVEAFGCEVKITSIEVLDIWGRLITTLPQAKDNKLEIGFLSSGVYVLKVFLTNGQFHAITIVKIS